MSKIKYAIIGFGGIAENRLAKEGFASDSSRFQPLENAELAGVTDINPARKDAVKSLGLKWYDSAEDIFKDANIDAVVVATNNLTHADICKRAMLVGKHVIVEKPMATTIENAEELVKVSKKSGISLAVDHMMTNNSYNTKAAEMVANGTLGTVNDSCFHMEFCYGATPEEAATWRCSSIAEMGGPIRDVGSHCMYLAEYIFNSKIESLACVYLPKSLNIKVEDGAYIKFKMSNGMAGSAKMAFS
ncbi:MAG: Gfo/Idh/MocA family oxidoreductase [Lentisphaerae bacterium]|nr:Gfo/Idh/MocA family oxidoreductase [Lentisphaerota bacterium]MCP4101850.1 Gfo/Idh/MocA family oxidoreductase [Lentisphaerota bacterium]